MNWTTQHDDLLLREVLLVEPYQFKEKTKARGNAWNMIAADLNSIEHVTFHVTKRSVRDRYNLQEENFR